MTSRDRPRGAGAKASATAAPPRPRIPESEGIHRTGTRPLRNCPTHRCQSTPSSSRFRNSSIRTRSSADRREYAFISSAALSLVLNLNTSNHRQVLRFYLELGGSALIMTSIIISEWLRLLVEEMVQGVKFKETEVMKRTVAFYWLSQRSCDGSSYRPVGNLNWWEHLSELKNISWDNKAIGNIRYDVLLDEEYPILSVYEEFDSAFMRHIDDKNKRVTDYMDDYVGDDSGRLAKSSAYAFFPNEGIVGRIGGSSTSRSVSPLERALARYWPPETGMKWNVAPVVTVDSLERFRKEVKGLSSLHAKFTTKQTLSSIPNEGGTAGEYCQKLASEIGADIDVDVKISISNDSVFSMPRRKFKSLVSDFVPFVAGQGKKMSVSGVDFADKLLELNLVEHPVTEQEEIVISKGETHQFTNLIKHLVTVCEQQEENLYRITRERQS